MENGDSDAITAQLDGLREQLTEELSADETKPIYLRNREKSDTTVSCLPLSLQYKVLTKEETYAKIKDADADRVTFAIGGKKLGTYKYTELSGKRISIEFEPETEEDAKALESYESIFETPAYLVSMKPVLKLDGEAVASGNAVILGTKQNFSMKVSSCGMETPVSNDITAGSMYQVTLDGQAITGDALESSYEEATAMVESATLENAYSGEYLGKVLDVAGKLYFAQLDIATSFVAEMYDVKTTRSLSEGMTGYQVETSSLYGSPVGVSEGSFIIDVDLDSRGEVSLTGNKEDEVAYMQVNGMLSSLYENLIWEEMTGAKSVSTMTVLKNATAQGIELLVLNEENYEEMSEKLEADSAALEDIEKAVKAGRQVTVPAKEVTMDDWTGTGYIIMDPESGAGAYRISGGLNGGIITGLVTTEAILGTTLMLIDIATVVSGMVSQVALLATGMVALSPGVLLMLVVELAFLFAAIYELVRLTNLYVKFMNGDLEAGEQVVTETMIGAALNVVFSSIEWIVRKCAGALRTSWKNSKLYKKIKELFGDVADDIDPEDGDGPGNIDGDNSGNTDGDGPGNTDGDNGGNTDGDGLGNTDGDNGGNTDGDGPGNTDGDNTGGDGDVNGTPGGTGNTGGTGGTSDGNLAGSGGGGSGTGTSGDLEGDLVLIKNNLVNKVKDIRAKMPNTNLAKRGNMAVADVDVPGIKDDFVAHSKINTELDKGADVADFSYLKSEDERIFTTYVDDQYPRYHDTEAKILEDIASQITDPNVSGTINLYSELPCCQSCSNIILEFRRMFPNIELIVFVE